MSSRDFSPQGDRSDLHGSHERSYILGITGRNTPPALQMQKGILYQMPVPIQMFVILALLLPVLFGWNDHLHSHLLRLLDDGIRVKAPIRQQTLRFNSFAQFHCLCAIHYGTRCNKYSDRHAMRIHGQMYLTIEPPFVTPIS
jgi:hypothetical protein